MIAITDIKLTQEGFKATLSDLSLPRHPSREFTFVIRTYPQLPCEVLDETGVRLTSYDNVGKALSWLVKYGRDLIHEESA